jgi:hypothetical protein
METRLRFFKLQSITHALNLDGSNRLQERFREQNMALRVGMCLPSAAPAYTIVSPCFA